MTCFQVVWQKGKDAFSEIRLENNAASFLVAHLFPSFSSRPISLSPFALGEANCLVVATVSEDPRPAKTWGDLGNKPTANQGLKCLQSWLTVCSLMRNPEPEPP